MRFLITSWRQTFRAFLFFSSNFDIAKRFSIVFILFSSKWSYLSPWWESARNAFQMLSNIPQLDFVLFRCTCASPARGLKRTIIVYKGQISWINGMMSSRIDIGLVSRLGFYRVDKFLFSMEYSFFRETGWIKRASGFVGYRTICANRMRFHRILSDNRGSVNGLVAFN